MMHQSLLNFFGLVLLGLATPVMAKSDANIDYKLIRAGEAVQLKPDRGYIMVQIDTNIINFSAVLLRVPHQTEIEAFDAAKIAAYKKNGKNGQPIDAFAFDYDGRTNLYDLAPGKAFFRDGKMITVIAEVPAGDYIFYGLGLRGGLYECLCLGTVGFAARAGEITDLGTMLIAFAAKPSPIPELAGEVDLGPSAAMDYNLFAVALRAPKGQPRPGLETAKINSAHLHAVGPFVEAGTQLINRLAGIPGVLRYDFGHVIDVGTGREMPIN